MSELQVEGAPSGSRVAGVGAGFAGAFGALLRIGAAVRREGEIRRARRRLERMPESMLKDIGIDRWQIDAVTRLGQREHGRRYL